MPETVINQSRASTVAALLKNVGTYSVSNIIYYGGLFGSTVMMARLNSNNPTVIAATGLMATTEAFGLHTIWAAEFAGGILIGGAVRGGHHEEVGKLWRRTMCYGTVVAIPVCVVFCFTAPIYERMGEPSDVATLTQDFTRLFAIGGVPFVWLGALEQLALAVNHLKVVVAIPCVYVGSYMLMSYPLVYGKWGFEQQGVKGVAIARSLSSWMTALLFMAYFKWRKALFGAYHLFVNKQYGWSQEFALLVMIGSNIAVQVGAELAGLYALSLIAGNMSPSDLGAYQINLQYLNIMVIVPITMAQSMGVMIGQHLGAHHDALARDVGYTGMWLSLLLPTMVLILSILIVLSVSVRDAVFSPFVNTHSADNHELLEKAARCFLINAVFQFPDGVRNTAAGALRGYQDTSVAMCLSVFNMCFLSVALGWVLGVRVNMGVEGLFLGRGIGMLIGFGWLWNRWTRRSFESGNNFLPRCGISCLSMFGLPGSAAQVGGGLNDDSLPLLGSGGPEVNRN